jgi:hypothetical protein
LAAFPGALEASAAADELDEHLKTLQAQVEDPSLAVEVRERIAGEMAATLDRAAQSAADPELRCRRWSQAIGLLDEFRKKNPDSPNADQLNVQASIYLWAQARTRSDQFARSPRDLSARDQAVAHLDDAISRLRAVRVRTRDESGTVSENVRYRLAQALTDRADLDREGSDARKSREDEAQKALEHPIKEPSLRGFALLLQGELLGRAGLFDEGLTAIEQAAKASPAPTAAELLQAKVGVLIRKEQFAAALTAIDQARVPESLKGLIAVQTRLAQRADLKPGAEQSAVESALFKTLKALRESGKPEAKLALMTVARTLRELDGEQAPDSWDLLAEGHALLGDSAEAGATEIQGADRAQVLGDAPKAIALRLRAGAYLLKAEKFAAADALLTRIYDDPKAGASRPKAGLLRIFARGRAVAARQPEITPQSYVAALEAQIKDFPKEPSTGEARWRLGQLNLAHGERETALKLLAAIPAGDPRWMESRLIVTRMHLDDLATLRIGNDRPLVKQQFDKAKQFISESRTLARTTNEQLECDLALARLQLTPEVGNPEESRTTCHRIQKSAAPPNIHDLATRLHIVALGYTHRFVEAEREAREEALAGQVEDLLETARLLDYAASESDSDLRMRRFGTLMRILLSQVVPTSDDLSAETRREVQLRQTRAFLLSGNLPAARQSLTSWASNPTTIDDSFLRDLADTYFRLEAFELAIEVERLRTKKNGNGSPRWFQARYGQALAYYRAGKEREARNLIDATSILHPELGGGDLRAKFVRLRQRLDTGEQ